MTRLQVAAVIAWGLPWAIVWISWEKLRRDKARFRAGAQKWVNEHCAKWEEGLKERAKEYDRYHEAVADGLLTWAVMCGEDAGWRNLVVMERNRGTPILRLAREIAEGFSSDAEIIKRWWPRGERRDGSIDPNHEDVYQRYQRYSRERWRYARR